MGRRVVRLPDVQVVEVDGAHMVTFPADEIATLIDRKQGVAEALIGGAYVRLDPPAGMSPDELAAIKSEVMKLGALAVKALPIPPTEDAVEALPDDRGDCTMCGGDGEDDGKACDRCGGSGDDPDDDGRGLRDVVHDRATRARNVDDPDALTAALDEAMNAAGL